jgi:hypothetical protein
VAVIAGALLPLLLSPLTLIDWVSWLEGMAWMPMVPAVLYPLVELENVAVEANQEQCCLR